jgi:ATP-dependent DNA helicase RecG
MLVMTATPIPRTVAITVFGDLDVSTLTELPAGRSPVSTHVVPVAERPHYLTRTWERIREEVGRGGQAYVVCPRIGGDEAGGPAGDELAGPGLTEGRPAGASHDGLFEEPELGPSRPPIAVLDLAAELGAGPLAGLRLAILHGRLPPDKKDKVMLAFADGLVDVLITTTVIEVGVDVSNAVVMVIMDADRFGVSQLHQLRGRVGRGADAGLCLLVTEAPEAAPARERLDAVASTADGFALSRIDLEQRREGDVLGTAQAGRRSSLKLLQLLRDEDLIGQAREEAIKVVDADPALADQPALAAAVRALVDAEQTTFLEKA